MSVLLVEDEAAIRSLVGAQLQDQGLHVTGAATIADARAALALGSYAVVILDLSLSDGSGLDVLDGLRASGCTSHVIILSGSTAEADRVGALQRGADDFVVKPFYLRELTARVLAVGRRRDPAADAVLDIGRIHLDLLARVVTVAGRDVELTAKEFDLLAYLAVRPGHVFDREELLNAVWQSKTEWQQAATVTEHIRRLRRKLEADPAHPQLLVTVRGAGYRLDLPTAQVERAAAPADPDEILHLDTAADSAARLRRLATGVLVDLTDAIIITDLHFHIRSWNPAAERLYGWTEEDVQGRHVLEVLHWVGNTVQLPEMWECMERTGRWHGESMQQARDGSVVEILSSVALVRDEDGAPVGIVSVNRAAVDARRARAMQIDAGLAARLRRGLADGEFVVHYQPVVDLYDGRLMTLEALVRWEHPDRGTLLPADFLDTAERSGLIVELGEFVLDEACRQTAAWRGAGADIHLSVNLSTRQLTDPGMVERFTAIVHDAGFDPSFLWLELTETAVVEELDRARQVLRELVDLGVGVAIDDFGTGWASLTYLQSFPVHALKIDRRFLAGAGRKTNDAAIIKSILSLGAELDMFVVAEGIETRDQLAAAMRLGCAFGQGYLFGRPAAAEDVPVERARRIQSAQRERGPRPASAVRDTALAVVVGSTGGRGLARAGATTHDLAPSHLGQRRAEPRWRGRRHLSAKMAMVESDAVADLLRGLLRVRSAPAAAELLQDTIRGMGGVLVPAVDAGEHALPVDVSLGEGPPVLVEVERFTVARMQLERLLPRLAEDARQAVDLLRQTERLGAETTRDQLTGLANRRVLDRVLPRATSGSVVMIDLDHFKAVNDEHGHAAGDAVLVSFADVLMTQVRAQDTCCRMGGEEFALVLADADPRGAAELVRRIRGGFAAVQHPGAVTFSAGVAPVGPEGGTVALLAADRALYTAKALGRDRTVEAAPADQTELG
jgi:diguanylate cyclase (GGDEF)-like protein/PAS domain S-box-containing protein